MKIAIAIPSWAGHAGGFYPKRGKAQGAFSLIEAVIYLMVVALIFELAYAAMYRSLDASKAIQRNAADIGRSLEAGERWRADVRNTPAPPRMETNSEGETTLYLGTGPGEIDYMNSTNTLWRRIGQGTWSLVLDNVQSSRFISDSRDKAAAWRWELELQPYRKQIGRVKPLFTFIAAVPNEKAMK